MTSATDTQRRAACLAALASACGVRLDGTDGEATAGLYLRAWRPYSPEEVEAAVQAYLRTATCSYGRLPMPAEITERIEAARGMAALRRFQAQLAGRRALEGRLSSARLAAEERHNRRLAALPASMPRAEWERARAASLDVLRSDLVAIDADGAAGLAALEAETVPALEVTHG